MGGGERSIEINESEEFCHDDLENNTIYVAVGKNHKVSKSVLLWAVQRFSGRKLCLLHVHQPSQLVSGKSPANKFKVQAVKVVLKLEQHKVNKLLNQYLLILAQAGVQAGKVWIEMDNIEKGIVQIIAQNRVRWLVMGTAAEKHNLQNTSELKSNEAIFLCQHAPVSCHIWFVCKGCLIYTSTALSSPTHTRGMTLLQNHAEDADEEANNFQCLKLSTSSIDRVGGTFKTTPLAMDEIREDGSLVASPCKFQDLMTQSSSIIFMEKNSQGQATCGIHDKLEHAMINAENLKGKAFEESVRRWRAEEDAIDAIRRAEESESFCMKEIKERKELEEMLARQRQELDRMNNQRDQFVKELQLVRDKKPELASQITESRSMEEELDKKIIQAANLLITFKEKRDLRQNELDNATKELNRLRKSLKEDAVILCGPQAFAFTFSEIIDATQNFDPTWKIGEGRYGSVYKGLIRHMKVAIKMLPCHGSQSDLEFEHEAEVLSRVRHPNLVSLIGTCPESRTLIYEYLENGSLEDRIACRDKAPPLPWQTRIKISIEICSALVFLHSNNPCIVHGNLKLTQVLLDANFVSKVSDLGIHRLISRDENSANTITSHNKTDPEVSVYMDPEFLETGEITAESDIYSFGIILLKLLTSRPASGILKDVKCAVENGKLNTLLDFSAGDWPDEIAKQLAVLALRCCEEKRVNRADLVSEIWTEIEPLRDLCTSSCNSCLDSKTNCRIPSYFVCPILQEVMEDPYIAADGFTYEGDAIKGWLNCGHKTSPMTNLELDHCDLLPNYALNYAIQEWRQKS